MKRLLTFSMATMLVAAQATAQNAATTAQRESTGRAGQASDTADATGAGDSGEAGAAARSGGGQGGANSGSTSGTSGASGTGTAGRSSSGSTQSATNSKNAGQTGGLDQHIAACLLLGNQEEVALGEFAQGHAQNDQVKQFAQQLVKEHQKAISQLEGVAPQLASMTKLSARGSGDNQREQTGSSAGSGQSQSGQQGASGAGAGDSATAASVAGAGGSSAGQSGGNEQQMLAFERQAKEECLTLTQKELGQKQGAEFDKAYMGQQLVAHTQMLAKLHASQQHAGGQLRQIVDQGAKMTEHHLAMGKEIMKQLEGQQGGAATAGQQTTQRSGTPRR